MSIYLLVVLASAAMRPCAAAVADLSTCSRVGIVSFVFLDVDDAYQEINVV